MRSFSSTHIAFIWAAAWLLSAQWLSVAASEEANPEPGIAELPAWSASGTLAVRSIVIDSAAVGRFEPVEATIDLAATYNNPFDPHDVEVRGLVTTPSGRLVECDGFFYQPYLRRTGEDDSQSPLLDATGPPCWKIRFTPTEVGRHRLQATVRDRSGQVESKSVEFQVVASAKPGFVRVSQQHGRYFEFDDGTVFFPVGQNLQNDWPVLSHLEPLARAGCNAVRPFLFCHWTWLEWSLMPSYPWAGRGHFMRSYAGAAHYNQRIAWIADEFFRRCERDGLRVMVCLGADELDAWPGYDAWADNPYNVSKGGFLATPEEFWTDPRARSLYRQRLRYIVARYGYSPAIWAWELWNERGQETSAMIAWHQEMAAGLRQIDPNRHLVTTSFWGTNPRTNPRTWEIPEIAFTQTHNYDGASTIRERTSEMLALSPKPHVVGEGGGPPGSEIDPGGIEFHNCLWAGALSGAAGATLPWHWRERIEPRQLFFHYTAIERFVRSVPWIAEKLVPVSKDDWRVSMPGDQPGLSPVIVVPLGPNWGRKAARNEFRIESDGSVLHLDEMSTSLYGSIRSEWVNPPTLDVEYPAGGRFVVHVEAASHAVLEIAMDDKTVLRDESLNKPRDYIRKDFGIDVPAGRHRITLRNTGADWIGLGHLLLTNYRDARRFPDVEVHAVASPRYAASWFHHRVNQWAFRNAGLHPQPITAAVVEVRGLNPGDYRVEWWDTYQGRVSKSEQVASRNNVLRLTVPPFDSDIACMLRRESM